MRIDEDTRLIAKRGATFLDTAYPQWFQAINTAVLDLEDNATCILGQIAEDYWDVEEWLRHGVDTDEPRETVQSFMIEHGFWAPDTQWGELEVAWVDEIASRKE